MNKAITYTLGMLLIGASATQITPALARRADQAPVVSNETFLNAHGSEGPARWCSEEPGNPYNSQTDYTAWSAWRAHGAWDSRNDC